MKKAISIFLLLIATAPLCQAQGLKDAYRDYWLTGVSVNQWEVAAVTRSEEHTSELQSQR